MFQTANFGLFAAPTLRTENRGLVWVTQVPCNTELTSVHARTIGHVANRTTPWYVRTLWTVLVLGTNVADDAIYWVWDVGTVITVVAWVTIT